MLTSLKHHLNSARTHQGFRRYLANTSWMFAEQMLRIFAGLLVGIWVARYLGPEQFGLFSYAIAFSALFGSIAKLGLDSVVVRNLVSDPNQRDLCMGTAFWLKLIGSIAMLAVMALTLNITSNEATTNLYILIIGSGTLFQSFEVVEFYFQSKVLSKFVTICKLIQLLISSLLKIYLVFTSADLIWFVMVSLIDQITLALSLFLAFKRQNLGNFMRQFNPVTAKLLLQSSWPLIISSIVIIIYMRIDQIMIKEMIGEKELGLFSAAVRLSEAWYFVPAIIANSLFTSIINAKNISKFLFYSRLQRLHTMLVWIAICVALPMTFLSDWIVTFLYGEMFRESGQILMIHIWAGVFVSLGVAQAQYWTVNNLQSKMMMVTGICSITNIVLNYFLIPAYGAFGAAIATLISYVVGSLIFPLIIKEGREIAMMPYKALIFRM